MTTLEHHGVKGMKWGKRKSYDKVGYMPGKIGIHALMKIVDAANKVRSAYMR